MKASPPIYFLDGGLGTTLADKFGCKFDDSTPLWSSQLLLSSTGSQVLQECHLAFVNAGADLITTATYQASTQEFINALAQREELQIKNGSADDEGIPNAKITYELKETKEEFPETLITTEKYGRLEREEINRKFCKKELTILQAHKYMRNAVKLARLSFGGKKGTVVLGLGAAGACLKPSQEYTGNYVGSEVGTSISSIRKWHLERLCVFAQDRKDNKLEKVDESLPFCKTNDFYNCWNDVDLVAFETLPLLQEIIAIREAMAQVYDIGSHYNLSDAGATTASMFGKKVARKDFWISCVFPGEEYQLPDGSSIANVIRSMLCKREKAEIPMGIGINCISIGKLETLIKKYEEVIFDMILRGEIESWPCLIIYPDGTNGEVYNTATHEWETKENYDLNSVGTIYLLKFFCAAFFSSLALVYSTFKGLKSQGMTDVLTFT
ncbi:putative homocysteine s-methyltransferase [Erysiphe neolycopersici]|uniref:Putative homocysteine s-methyltransferase n=1 Tax=Erysiphe neolycopersici TaxID=212602 RepID=A0A420HI50_9PEZI|nr:putative homocysteine s-methyltransferase [Erysiphe neolycopersici]